MENVEYYEEAYSAKVSQLVSSVRMRANQPFVGNLSRGAFEAQFA